MSHHKPYSLGLKSRMKIKITGRVSSDYRKTPSVTKCKHVFPEIGCYAKYLLPHNALKHDLKTCCYNNA